MSIPCPNCGSLNRDGARFCGSCRAPLEPSRPAAGPGVTGMIQTNALLAGRYVILHKIGQGGMAAVYLVADSRLSGKQWALKEMSDAAVTDPLQKQRAVGMFQREMEMLSQLRHRNIPQVIDTFTCEGKHFIVMEYVDGMTLEDLVQQQGGRPCPEAQVQAWFAQLCDVLDYLHAQNPPVIFRDLKPSNIMVDRTGTIKLIDFGIARFFSPHKTQDTQFFGTAGYAAPEQYGGSQTDARSDVYSLGITLYHLLTGYDPARTPVSLPPIDQFHVQVSPAMRRVIQRAVEQDRARRWGSVREMAQAVNVQVAAHAPGGGAAVPFSAGFQPAAGEAAPPTMLPVRVAPNRPTTRLLLTMARMSNTQLALLGLALVAVFAVGAYLLTPLMTLDVALALPLYLMAGPLAYAASQRRGTAFAAHVLVTGVVWFIAQRTAKIAIGDDLWLFVAGLLASGVVMEALLLLHKNKPSTPWWQDCLWLAAVTAVGGLVALGIPTLFGEGTWLRIWLPFSAALIGALGWFLGDLYHQRVLLKQSGSWQRPQKG